MSEGKRKRRLMDVYEPVVENAQLRPLIIWIHGGGFRFGSKKSRGIPIWSKSFARRGYVSVAINFRKSKISGLRDFKALARGCYTALEDLEQVVAWCKKNQQKLKIDTGKIILAGNSAGGMLALQAVYSGYADLARIAEMENIPEPSEYNFMNIAGVVNFWGAVYDSTSLQRVKVPIVSVHGTEDKIVPYYQIGIHVYGSGIIHRQADVYGIPNRLKTYEGLAHELQKPFHPFLFGAKAKRRWLEAGQFAADFLYEEVVSK